eukprot:TRINITY_DN60815_c0_g1_i2.p1 TRINITY_DN60815_c0_g1~~TRINITY_DN60815_c0_g1_i2.p1  ORF type:complete len:389 (-),score=83.68 TRINITY_DN60815_c0_g1_i2:243-1409(-)
MSGPSHHRSIVFANNKGGSGKTFTLVQAAAELARADPDLHVLVIDLSLYSDTSGLLMGGLRRESILAATHGLEATLKHTTLDNRVEGLLRDLLSLATEQPSESGVLGSLFGARRHVPPRLDLSQYMVQPSQCNSHIPENLRLIASAAQQSWHPDAMGHHVQGDWWTTGGNEWQQAASALRAAIKQLPGEWVVLMDTDHLTASPLSKLALGCADQTVVPLSLDEGDFRRMYEDPTGNALLTDVMEPMAQRGVLTAPISKFVFTKINAKNTASETAFGICSPVKPAAGAQRQMDSIAEAVLEATRAAPELQQCLAGFDPGCPSKEFARSYFTAFKTVSDLALNASKLSGAPLCMMQHNDSRLGDCRPDGKTLAALQTEIVELVECIMGKH